VTLMQFTGVGPAPRAAADAEEGAKGGVLFADFQEVNAPEPRTLRGERRYGTSGVVRTDSIEGVSQ
jgi:hypothetical protein